MRLGCNARPVAHPQAADIEFSIRAKGESVYAGIEAFDEWEHGTLPFATDLFQHDPHHAGVLEFTNQQLAFEGAEAIVRNRGEAARGANPRIRKPDRRRLEFRI